MLNRRKFFERALAGGALISFPLPSYTKELFRSFSQVDVEIKLKAVLKKVSIKNGALTKVFSYEGELLKGESSNLTTSGSYLGPTIQIKKGQTIRIHFENHLKDESIVHWHGLDVDSENDGHPKNAIKKDETFIYEFKVEDRAGLYWYHPHPHGKTGHQVYMGLAGLFIIRDDEERNLLLPSGDRELPLVIQDRSFNSNNQFKYNRSMMGAYGRDLLINGKVKNSFKVVPGPYRIRLLNGCNARIFKLAFNQDIPLQILGVDGGLLKKTETLNEVFFSPGERLDLWVDFSKISNSETLTLSSIPLVEGRGEPYEIMNFKVEGEDRENYYLPNHLSDYKTYNSMDTINPDSPKKFKLGATRAEGWTINGRGYKMNEILENEKCQFGTKELWEFENNSGMPHPMHIHGSSFQILKREGNKYPGTFDSGRKDIVLVFPGEKVTVLKSFEKKRGLFVYHCHNLEHEDMSMMRNFLVE